MHRQQAKQNRNNKILKGRNKNEAVANHIGITCPKKYRYFFSACDPWAEEMQQLHFLKIKEAEAVWPNNNTVMSRSSKHISPNYLSNLTTFAKMQHLYVEHNCQDELTLSSLKQRVSWESWFLVPSILQVTFKVPSVETFPFWRKTNFVVDLCLALGKLRSWLGNSRHKM